MIFKRPKRARPYLTRQVPHLYGDLRPAKRDWSRLWRFLIYLAFLGITGAIGYLVFFSQVFTVKQVEIIDAVMADPEAVAKTVPLGGSIWFLPEKQIVDSVIAEYPMEGVIVSRGLPNTVRLRLQEKVPQAIWHSAGVVSLLDSEGLVILQYSDSNLPVPESRVGMVMAKLVHIDDQVNLPVAPGKAVLSSYFIQFTKKLMMAKESLLPQLKVKYYQIADTTYDLTMLTEPGLTVQFSTLSDPNVQMRNLARILIQKKATFQSVIDLRTDHWAYVK